MADTTIPFDADPVTEENQAERVAWLRERGVEIEFAKGDPDNERYPKAPPRTRTITIVKIPWNEAVQSPQLPHIYIYFSPPP